MLDVRHYDTFNDTGHELAWHICVAIRKRGGEARIGTTWRDYGARYMWDTIIVETPNGVVKSFQLLHPVEFDKLNDGTITANEMEELVDRALKYS